MGSYTTKLKLYKPDPSEFVNVDSHLNGNLDIVDFNVRGMFDYELYGRQSFGIDSDVLLSRQVGHKFYKTYSNSVWVADGIAGGNGSQDANAFVSDWHNASSLISTASGTWTQYPGQSCCYRVISAPGSGTTEVEWAGKLWLGGSALTNQFTYNPVMDLTTAFSNATPVVNKYFDVSGGNTAGGYAIVRVIFASNGQVAVFRNGQGTGTTTAENYVDFGGIRYNLEVTG